MDNNSIYILTNEADSLIHKDVEFMGDWLNKLNQEDLSYHHEICNKNQNERSEDEEYEICKLSLILYCRELGLDEISITSDLIMKITGAFCYNIIMEALNRKGMVEINGTLMIYKETEIKLTSAGSDTAKIIDSEEKNKKKDNY